MDLMIKVILQNIMVKKAQESKQMHHFQSWHWEVKTFEKFEELSLLYSAHPRVSTAWGGRPRGRPVHFPASIVEDIRTTLLGKLKRVKINSPLQGFYENAFIKSFEMSPHLRPCATNLTLPHLNLFCHTSRCLRGESRLSPTSFPTKIGL